MLLAVNAGSNTISMFRINPEAPWELTMIAPPIDSQGDFPNSITYSEALNMGKSALIFFNVRMLAKF